jgi:hypothetical protein
LIIPFRKYRVSAIAGNDPFTDTQLVRIGYTNLDSTGKLSIACREWRAKPRLEQTWPHLKTHFKAAHLDLRLGATTGSAGYRANHTDTNTDTGPNDSTDAYLANLASATLETNEQVRNLTATVTQLQQQMATATAALSNDRRSNDRRPNERRTGNTRPPPAVPGDRYCWTHGARVRKEHTSANCTNRREGHQTLATFLNRMGGSDVGCVVI